MSRTHPGGVVAAGLVAAALAAGVACAQGARRGEVRVLEPAWIVAGKSTPVRIYGQDLSPEQIRFEVPGIVSRIARVETLMPKNDEERRRGNRLVEVEISPAADVRPGRYPFQLVGPGTEGVLSVPGRITIDVPAPEKAESEPNDSLARPEPLPGGPITVTGKLDREGVDVFRFEGKRGETWRIEVFARRLDPATKLEAVLRLRDPRLAPVRVAVDQGEDCFLEYRLPADGPYVIELFDGESKTGADQAYRLALRRL